MSKPQTLPYTKIIEYSKPADIPFEFLKKTTAHHPVFLSSRFTGMEQLRKLVAEKFTEYGYPVMGWELGENFGSTQKRPPREVYLDALKKSKVYCGVLDTSYGPDIIDGCSATEDEYNHAITWGHELCLLTGKTEPKEDKTKTLISKWRGLHTVSSFASEVELVTAVDLFIKNHILRIGMNWIMIDDVILPSGYKTSSTGVSVQFSTANASVVSHLKRFSPGQEIGFIDLSEGIRLDLIVEDIQFNKLASSVWAIDAQFKKGVPVVPMSWQQWSQLKDIGLTKDGDLDIFNGDFRMVSGIEHVPQAIKLALNVNRGERVMRPEIGSNLYNILDAFADYPELAELLIKFDVIETLTRPTENHSGDKSYPAFACVESVDVQRVSNISKRHVDLKLKLSVKGHSVPLESELAIKWTT